MSLFSKIFVKKDEEQIEVNPQEYESIATTPRLTSADYRQMRVDVGYELDEDGNLIYTVEKAQQYFSRFEELIREGSLEILDYGYLDDIVSREDLERFLNDPKSVIIWKKVFADFKLYYGNYDLPEAERLKEWASCYTEFDGEEASFSISYKSRSSIMMAEMLNLLDLDLSLLNGSDDDVYEFVDRALEVMPCEYNMIIDSRIEDGRLKLNLAEIIDNCINTGLKSQTIFEAYMDTLDELKKLLESKPVSIDDLWDENRKIAEYYILASKKRYVEAIEYAIANKVFRPASLEYFQTKLDVYNSFDQTTRNRIVSLIDSVPEGNYKFYIDEGFDSKVDCALLGYIPCVFIDDENPFDTNEVLYAGTYASTIVDKENLIVSDVEEDDFGACRPFFELVGEFEERLMDEEFKAQTEALIEDDLLEDEE